MSRFLDINIKEKYSKYHLKLKFACERPLSPLQLPTDFLLGSISHMICPLPESPDMKIKENYLRPETETWCGQVFIDTLRLIDFLSRGNLVTQWLYALKPHDAKAE